MRAIRRIEIRTRRLVNQGMGGEYHSVFKGRGMEFSEVREYLPGDDVRTIDWNVTSRTGSLHVKKYIEERELTVLLAVDVSRSGDFGSVPRSKLETAAEVAAVLAFSAVRNNDRVGLVLFTDEVEVHVPPAKGPEHVLRVVREVLCHEPQGRGTSIAKALQSVTHSLKKRAIVFLVSDFLDDGWEFPLRVAGRKHDVVAAVVSDPREAELPDVGLAEMLDAETGVRRLVDTSRRSVREAHARAHAGRVAWRDQVLRRLGVDTFEVRTDQPYDAPIMKFFRARERRSRRSG
jgi:uncharacterized protein (DUF58 family)